MALCNQDSNRDHQIETVSFHKKASVKASGRVSVGEMNTVGIVSYEFFDHTFLKPDPKQRISYLLNDSLLFRVMKVTLTE